MGGGGGSPEQPTYTSRDGVVFTDPNKAADRDRRLSLAGALGYQQGKDPQRIVDWVATQDPSIQQKYNTYNTQGLTAADLRAEQRLQEQQSQSTQAENQRQSSIAASRAAVDKGLTGFDDNYYKGISKAVMDYYMPQLDQQFGDANENLTYDLARKGGLRSTSAGTRRSDLQSRYDLQRGDITNRAADAEQQARNQVASTRNQLYSYADTAADPGAVDQRIGNETARLRAYAPELTPMGQMFSDYASPIVGAIGTGLGAEAKGYKGFGTGLFDTNSGSSGARVVR